MKNFLISVFTDLLQFSNSIISFEYLTIAATAAKMRECFQQQTLPIRFRPVNLFQISYVSDVWGPEGYEFLRKFYIYPIFIGWMLMLESEP